jgi:hypothetical protein
MRKMVIIMITSLMMASCAGFQPVPPEQLYVQKVMEVPGMTKKHIYGKSRLWIARNFKPYKAVWLFERKTASVVEYASENEGILIATGTIPYPRKTYSLTEGHKAYWEVTFTMEEDIKDGKVRVTFSNLGFYVPKLWCGNIYSEWLGAYDKPLTAAEDMEAVRPVLTEMADRLGEFLRSSGTGDQW